MDPLAVIIVTHASQDVIGACLDSLLSAEGPVPRVVVVDNASNDATCDAVVSRGVELIRSHRNRGFAAGVNLGLARLSSDPTLAWFWVLNPDCRVPATTPDRYRRACAAGGFGLLGGRTLYAGGTAIQSDGGRLNRWTGVCKLVNRGAPPDAAPPAADTLDFLSGANMIVSRNFLDRAGPMPENYFLFYEEVDWALRRGDLPIRFVPDAPVEHAAGTATGSAGPDRSAGAFANYFNYRARMRFLGRHRPAALPVALPHALLRSADLARRGDWSGASAALRGTLGLAPPSAVRRRLALSGAVAD